MSEHGSLQFVWDIMLQSEWWKQYSEMVERSLAEQAGEGNVAPGFDVSSGSGSWNGSYSALLMSSGSGSWSGSYSAFLMSSGSGSGAGSGAWWLEIPEAWWSSFAGSWLSSFAGSFEGSWWNSSAGSGAFGSGCVLGYGLQLI